MQPRTILHPGIATLRPVSDRLQLALVGAGRIGAFHARHVAELAACDGSCQLAALVDPRPDLAPLAREMEAIQNSEVNAFASLETCLDAGGIDAAVVDGQSYNAVPAFAVPSNLVALWSALLGLEGEQTLDNAGFMLVRVLASTDDGLVPVQDAALQHTNPHPPPG